jgi:hypothetical protein
MWRISIGGKGELERDRTADLGKIHSICKSGLISERESQFLMEEYLRDFRSKNGWDGKTDIAPRTFLG